MRLLRGGGGGLGGGGEACPGGGGGVLRIGRRKRLLWFIIPLIRATDVNQDITWDKIKLWSSGIEMVDFKRKNWGEVRFK